MYWHSRILPFDSRKYVLEVLTLQMTNLDFILKVSQRRPGGDKVGNRSLVVGLTLPIVFHTHTHTQTIQTNRCDTFG